MKCPGMSRLFIVMLIPCRVFFLSADFLGIKNEVREKSDDHTLLRESIGLERENNFPVLLSALIGPGYSSLVDLTRGLHGGMGNPTPLREGSVIRLILASTCRPEMPSKESRP
ncbi:hypothetical protein EDD21DRAFT_424209 [Dissophora ornata]|nr:hypothetical protein EDD21DRAFT_424209 [Dissophora ornata]